MIYVTSLFEMPEYVRALRPGSLVSIIQPELQPDTPAEIDPRDHHRVPVHDIAQPEPGSIHPSQHHVAALIEFLQEWSVDRSLMIHCYAGNSRSTAAALIALAMKKSGSELDAAAALRRAAPHAQPNRLIVSLADRILGLEGRLVAGREAMGAGEPARAGTLVELPVPVHG